MKHNKATLPPNQTLDVDSKRKHQDSGVSISIIPGPGAFREALGSVSWSPDRSSQSQLLLKSAVSLHTSVLQQCLQSGRWSKTTKVQRKKSVVGYKAEEVGTEELQGQVWQPVLTFLLITSAHNPQ